MVTMSIYTHIVENYQVDAGVLEFLHNRVVERLVRDGQV